MVDAFTSNRDLIQPLVGGDSGTWGGLINNGLSGQLDLILGATQGIAITVADVTLTTTQWNNCAIKLTGALTADRALVLPFNVNSSSVAVGGLFVVDNQTSGAFNVTVKTAAAGSAGVTVPQGVRTWLYSDTVNVYYADDSKVQIIPYAGNPNGHVAGTAASLNNPPSVVWDYTNGSLYFCTTTGIAAAAVWTQPAQTVTRGFDMPVNFGLSVTHTGGNLLQVAVKTASGADPTNGSPVICPFQTVSGANFTGAPTTVNITSALSMTTNSTAATLGTANSVPFRIWFALFNNAGTAVLAMRVCSTAKNIYSLAEYGVASTVSISGGATSPGVWYTPNGTTLTNCAFRVIGYCEYSSGLATAGSFTSDPTSVVLFGPGVKLPGAPVQSLYDSTGALFTSANNYTLSNTAPTAAQGISLLTVSLAPTSPINHVRAWSQVITFCDSNSGLITSWLMHNNTTTLAVGGTYNTAGCPGTIPLFYEALGGAVTSPWVFELFAAASVSTLTVNGNFASPFYGGTGNTFIRAEEIMG